MPTTLADLIRDDILAGVTRAVTGSHAVHERDGVLDTEDEDGDVAPEDGVLTLTGARWNELKFSPWSSESDFTVDDEDGQDLCVAYIDLIEWTPTGVRVHWRTDPA